METKIWFSPRSEEGHAQMIILDNGQQKVYELSLRRLVSLAKEALVVESEVRAEMRMKIRLAQATTFHDAPK